MPSCEKCQRELKPGDEAFETEWKKIDVQGDTTRVRLVNKYECAPKCPREAAS
ncbi:MAG: hypothetical protein L0I76_16205 [Pseudonocardia sp.]|nr:hypothetical protein [Pseudonocardia sp.]